jgi:hypothetical protein
MLKFLASKELLWKLIKKVAGTAISRGASHTAAT